ncbi:hypothetical protein BaRGS_00034955 [Batillaria attramentaria]|uniref:Metallothionein n=1 Tax=Batillaria attramentaria TaxID=370345 RepID=A0ABD0JFY8_9CAEN
MYPRKESVIFSISTIRSSQSRVLATKPEATFPGDELPAQCCPGPKDEEDCACDESTSGGLLDMTGQPGGQA